MLYYTTCYINGHQPLCQNHNQVLDNALPQALPPVSIDFSITSAAGQGGVVTKALLFQGYERPMASLS